MIDLRDLDRFRDLDWEQRINPGAGNRWPRDCGCFRIPYTPPGQPLPDVWLRCLVSSGRLDPSGKTPWDHVSVSLPDRTPTWAEMDMLARLFFRPDEVAMQLHVPTKDHVNHMPFCLHMWRPTGLKKIPVPPSIMVGPDSSKGKR